MRFSHVNDAVKRLKGTTYTIPNLMSFFDISSLPLNANYAPLRQSVNEFIDSLYPTNKLKVEKVKQFDMALLASLWWPTLDMKRLNVLSFFIVWLLLWDDELDSRHEGLGGDRTAADEFRAQTQAIVSMSLGLANIDADLLADVKQFLKQFYPLGKAIKNCISEGNRILLMQAMRRTLKDSKKEQMLALANEVPSLEEYWEYRAGTNLMDVVYPITGLAADHELCANDMENPLLKEYWEQINRTIAIENDILSFKKEIDKNETLNLVFLLYLRMGCLQSALDASVQMLLESIEKERRLKARVLSETEPRFHRFIQTWEFYASGFLYWSLITPRYSLSSFLQEDGSLTVQLKGASQ